MSQITKRATFPLVRTRGSQMNDHEIVLAIQDLLDGVEWDVDTLNAIAEVLAANGYAIHDLDGTLTEDVKS
jgi:hypothetical protein